MMSTQKAKVVSAKWELKFAENPIEWEEQNFTEGRWDGHVGPVSVTITSPDHREDLWEVYVEGSVSNKNYTLKFYEYYKQKGTAFAAAKREANRIHKMMFMGGLVRA